MAKEIYFEKTARQKLQAGADKLANVVKSTLGPKGKMVAIDRGGEPTFTLDGVTVAKEIFLKDKAENMGAELVKQAAEKSNDEAGDGTTTATILSQSLLTEGMKGVDAGLDPIGVVNGMEEAKGIVLSEIRKMAVPVKTIKDMVNVGTISSRDPEMGSMIAEIYEKIGKDGMVAVEELRSVGMSMEVVQGMEIESGWIGPVFVTNPQRKEAIIDEPYILVTTQVINKFEDIFSLLEMVQRTEKKSLVIVCDDMSGNALATCAINKLKGILRIAVVRAPGHGLTKKDYLMDLATVTGATLISEEFGEKLEELTMEKLGRCGRVILTEKRGYFVDGKGKKSEVKERGEVIKTLIADPKLTKYQKELLEKRFARMSGGVGLIRIGCATEKATEEAHYRLEDAIKAVRASLEEGVVIGGGLALVRASGALNKRIGKEMDIAVRYGLEMVRKAIRQPALQVIKNRGDEAEVVLAKVEEFYLKNSGGKFGYNAKTGVIVQDMFAEGIIDPHKVVRVALEGAVNVVGLFLRTDSLIHEEEKEHDEKEPRSK